MRLCFCAPYWVVEMLVDETHVNKSLPDGETPLMMAALNPDVDVLKLLLSFNPTNVDAKSKGHLTAMRAAALRGHVQHMEALKPFVSADQDGLVEACVNTRNMNQLPNMYNRQRIPDPWGRVTRDRIRSLNWVLQNYPAHTRPCHPLMIAMQAGDATFRKAVWECFRRHKQLDIPVCVDKDGLPLLFLVIATGQLDIVKEVLQKTPAHAFSYVVPDSNKNAGACLFWTLAVSCTDKRIMNAVFRCPKTAHIWSQQHDLKVHAAIQAAACDNALFLRVMKKHKPFEFASMRPQLARMAASKFAFRCISQLSRSGATFLKQDIERAHVAGVSPKRRQRAEEEIDIALKRQRRRTPAPPLARVHASKLPRRS